MGGAVPTDAPQAVDAVAVSSTSIRITWSPPPFEEQNGVIRFYYINVTELQTGHTQQFTAYGDETLQIVNLLHPFYIYECSVAAFTVGVGPAAYAQAQTDPSGVWTVVVLYHYTHYYAKPFYSSQ